MAEHPLGDVGVGQVGHRDRLALEAAVRSLLSTSKSTLWWLITTPLGFPVVPEV